MAKVQGLKYEGVSFNLTHYRALATAGRLSEEEFIANGLREQLYKQYPAADRRTLLRAAYRLIVHGT